MATLSDRIDDLQQPETSPNNITALIAALAGSDGLTRQQARYTLVEIGEPAVEPLIEALNIQNSYVHWEAAKALSQIASPRSVEALVKTLQDNELGIRWIAAEGLVTIGRESLTPLMHALIHQGNSFSLQESAHHVLHDLIRHPRLLDEATKEIIRPVLQALEGTEPAISAPVAALSALQQLAPPGPLL